MKTLCIKEAAEFLCMHPESLRRKVVTGEIPGLKPGRRWVFVQQDLVEWMQGRYSIHAQQAPRLALNGGDKWHYSNAVKPGGSALRHQVGSKYAALLGLQTEKQPKNTMTA